MRGAHFCSLLLLLCLFALRCMFRFLLVAVDEGEEFLYCACVCKENLIREREKEDAEEVKEG